MINYPLTFVEVKDDLLHFTAPTPWGPSDLWIHKSRVNLDLKEFLNPANTPFIANITDEEVAKAKAALR